VLVCVSLGFGVLASASIAAPVRAARAMLRTSVQVLYAPSADHLSPLSTLTAGGVTGPVGFGEVAAAGQTIAAAIGDRAVPLFTGAVVAFSEPAGGWSSAASRAQLTAADGDRLGSVATSATTVAAGDASIGDTGPSTAYVFVEPAGGWSGASHEAAMLVAPSTGSGIRAGPLVAVSGNTVFTSDGDTVDAFTEPAGGWSGIVHASAQLTASSGVPLDALAASGPTVVAGSQDAVYVFSEPSGSWVGARHQTATLMPSRADLEDYGGLSGNVAISGSTVVAASSTGGLSHAAAYAFDEPASGWSDASRQPTTLSYTTSPDALGPWVAASNGTVVLGTANPGAVVEHECPCSEGVYAISVFSGGLAETGGLGPSASISPTGGGPDVAIDGRTLSVGAQDGIHLFTVSAPARVSHMTLTGLVTHAPRLVIQLSAGEGSAPIKSVAVTFPRTLELTKDHRRLAKLISVSGTRSATLRIRGAQLLLTLHKPVGRPALLIDSGALSPSPALTRALEAILNPGRQTSPRPTRLSLAIRLTDTEKQTTNASINITLS